VEAMITNKPPGKNSRLIGIDLLRGVAAYAGVVIHTGKLMIYSGFPTNEWTAALTEISRFAVPFFLATSFYFMTSKLYTTVSHFSCAIHLKSKWYRLLVPYLCWNIIYLSLRLIKALGIPDGLGKLFQDPVMLIFLGGSSIHLYFLPLLFLGSFLITVPEYLIRRQINIKAIAFLCVSSMAVYELIIVSGNDFQFGSNCLEDTSSCSVAFQSLLEFALPSAKNNQLLRLVLVALAWLAQCLPYIFMAMAVNHPAIEKNIRSPSKYYVFFSTFLIIFISIAWVISTCQSMYFSRPLYELIVAFFLLVIGIYLSKKMQDNWMVNNLGTCSFGIYLMHYLILVIYTTLIDKLAHGFLKISPTLTMLILATLSFGTSWVIIQPFSG
jgi:peptidoglycan/LPS O-acetylase OafA/YrhL